MTKTVDVAIIGGGIMGCSTAFQLAKRGVSVAVIEKSSIGAGPTGHSSAIIRQHYSNELTARMALYGLRVFQNFEEEVGGECGYTADGFLALIANADAPGLEMNIALQQSVGIDARILSADALKEMVPSLASTDLVKAAYEPESGYADPYLTVNAYAQAARRHGAAFLLDTKVTGVRFADGKVVGVDTTAGAVDAPIIINATGAWAAKTAALANLSLPITSSRVQVSLFRRPAGEEKAHPVIADFIHALYFRSETGGLTLVGLIDPAEADAIVNPDNFGKGVSDDFVLESGERLIKRYPAMELSQSTGGYASLYAITPDWHPIIDELPAGSGFYTCSGFSGHGFKLSPAVGLMMADLVMKVENPLFDAKMFRYGRFADNDLVTSKYTYSIVG